MDRASYRELVARLEEEARRSPEAMRTRVLGHIALGYGYVGLVVLSLVAAIVLVIWAAAASRGGVWAVKFVVALGAILIMILRSLWVRIEAPAGMPLHLHDVPRLAARVEEIRRALRSPRPDHVLLTEDFNAAVTQVPRLGIFGFPSTYLILGLPLLCGLSPAQFDAVLAHEFAHLSGAHPKRGLWVYRMGRTWHQLMDQMEAAKSAGAVLFRRFVRWYVPRLDAYGFVMSRQDEYAADADAASVTSPATMGSALVALHARGPAFDQQVWTEIWSRAAVEAEPPAESWTSVPRRLRDAEAQPIRNVWVGRALVELPSEHDTHPTLRERLQALGVFAPEEGTSDADRALALMDPFTESAADRYLGAIAEARLRALEATWRAGVRDTWRERYQRTQAARAELTALAERDRAGETLDLDSLFRFCSLTADLEGDVAARPLAQRVLALEPAHASAHFILGRGLLAEDDEAGVAHLERVIAIDPNGTPEMSNLLYGYYARRGDKAAIARIEERFDTFVRRVREAAAERDAVGKRDTLVAPELTDDERTMLARVLRRFDGFRTMLVARKVTIHHPDRPMLVLLAERRFLTFTSTPDSETVNDMIGHVRFERGQDVLLIIAASSTRWLRRRMKAGGAIRIERMKG